MKHIGFIDYYLDEWHANNYPKMIQELSQGEMKVSYAYGDVDAPTDVTSAQWCEKNGIELIDSIESLVEKSDCIVVLSPDHPEHHVRLSELALASGKPVFIDKTFAPDVESGLKMFEIAEANNTPMYSCSSLRFSNELASLEPEKISFMNIVGPGQPENYLIHQVEPIVAVMGPEITKMMFVGTEATPSWVLQFAGERAATMTLFGDYSVPFSYAVGHKDGTSTYIPEATGYFDNFLKGMVEFFNDPVVPVQKAETMAIMKVLDKASEAKARPGEWLTV